MNYISFKINEEIKVKKFLEKNDFSKRAITDIVKAGYIIDDINTSNNQALKAGDILKIPIEDENLDYDPIKGKLDIVYEDCHILVVDKAANLTVNSKGQESLANHLAYYFKENNIKSKIRLVNRLDMNTSGLLMVAKNPYSFAYYQRQIEDNNFFKYYLAVVEGNVKIDKTLKTNLAYNEDRKRYEVGDEGKLAISHFKTIDYDQKNNISYIKADIKTGKTHQIRSQLSYLSHPIIGDKLYGSNIEIDRFLLHCSEIKFQRFIDRKLIDLKSKPPFSQYLVWKTFPYIL